MLNFQKKIINNYFRFSKINIIRVMRNSIFYLIKIIALSDIEKPNR
uniref:Uncharacterized protein n=1 Tax=Acinetobacter sp. M131 TaxID=1280052 RepID=V9M6A4_9GAMM|nr:hypothetical protein [Acinetobacter sp. M131]